QYLAGDQTKVTEVDSYDYGTKGNGVGPVVRKVTTQYNGVAGSTNVPSAVFVSDAGGVTKAQTNYTYDETAVTGTTGTPNHTSVSSLRGNLTTIATKVNGSVTLYRRFTYFDTGTPNTATDAGTTTSGGPNVTSYVYDNSGTAPHTNDCGNSFVTKINEPLSLLRSFTWDCDGGVMTSVTDENGKVATVFYTGTGADAFYWRPYQAQDQLTPANTTGFTYPSVTASES